MNPYMKLIVEGDNVRMTVLDGAGRRAVPIGSRPTDAVINRIKEVGPVSTGLLPPALRWVSSSGRQAIFERPPRQVTFEYSPKAQGSVDPKFRLVQVHLPWTVYGISLSQDFYLRLVKLYASLGPLMSMDDRLGKLPVSNLYDDGHFCLPGGMPPVANLSEGFQQAYQAIWMARFNTDIWDVPATALKSGHPKAMTGPPQAEATKQKSSRLLTKWETMSREEVLAIRDWTGQTTIAHLIQEMEMYNQQMYTPMHLMTTLRHAFQTLPGGKAPDPGDLEEQEVLPDLPGVIQGPDANWWADAAMTPDDWVRATRANEGRRSAQVNVPVAEELDRAARDEYNRRLVITPERMDEIRARLEEEAAMRPSLTIRPDAQIYTGNNTWANIRVTSEPAMPANTAVYVDGVRVEGVANVVFHHNVIAPEPIDVQLAPEEADEITRQLTEVITNAVTQPTVGEMEEAFEAGVNQIVGGMIEGNWPGALAQAAAENPAVAEILEEIQYHEPETPEDDSHYVDYDPTDPFDDDDPF